jgi:putative two-component system response regulator
MSEKNGNPFPGGLLERPSLQLALEEVIYRLAAAAEFRRVETRLHLMRVSRYCFLLAQKLGLDENRCLLIRDASPLHDVGNISIPNKILMKAARHAPQEYEIMKQHASIGHEILEGSESDLIQTADSIAWTHHEKFDGTGYPRGLDGDTIPLEGRICAVADVFDALTTKRVYKPVTPVDRSVEIMKEGRGGHFDPEVVDLFLENIDEVLAIKETCSEE